MIYTKLGVLCNSNVLSLNIKINYSSKMQYHLAFSDKIVYISEIQMLCRGVSFGIFVNSLKTI